MHSSASFRAKGSRGRVLLSLSSPSLCFSFLLSQRGPQAERGRETGRREPCLTIREAALWGTPAPSPGMHGRRG